MNRTPFIQCLAAFVATALTFLIYWLAGGEFERGPDLAFTGSLAVILGLCAAAAAGLHEKEKKP